MNRPEFHSRSFPNVSHVFPEKASQCFTNIAASSEFE